MHVQQFMEQPEHEMVWSYIVQIFPEQMSYFHKPQRRFCKTCSYKDHKTVQYTVKQCSACHQFSELNAINEHPLHGILQQSHNVIS